MSALRQGAYAGGLSNSATKGLLDVKASLKIPVESKDSVPATMEDMVTFTKSPVKEDKSKGEETCLKKKNFKTISPIFYLILD